MIAAVILAAGSSQRMGRPKLTLPWRGSQTIIRHMVDIYHSVGAAPIVVVSPEKDDDLKKALAGLDVRQVPASPGAEMLASVQTGLAALEDSEAEAALLAPGDHPLLDPGTVALLIDAWRARQGAIIAPSIDGRRGHPILVARSVWPEIVSLEADRSLRDFLRHREEAIFYVFVEDRGVIRDVDTPQDYDQALREADGGPFSDDAPG